MNLYTYCENNPLIYIDPSGYIKESEVKLYNSGKMSPGAYSYLMYLTYKWYLADSKKDRNAIHAETERFRANNYKYGDSDYYNELIKQMSSRPSGGEITKEEHFFRNKLNLEFAKNDFDKLSQRLPEDLRWNVLPDEKSVFHNIGNGFKNYKYVSGCGHFEAVYDFNNNLVTDATNMVPIIAPVVLVQRHV